LMGAGVPVVAVRRAREATRRTANLIGLRALQADMFN
jgi:hypothetical protein